MINKPNIQEKINAQKTELLKRLINDFKIPVIDIIVDKNSEHLFNGIFYMFVSEKIKINVGYNYSNKSFDWNKSSVTDKIDGIWHTIYLAYKDEIDAKILTTLQINDVLQIEKINYTKNNILKVHIKNIAEPITIQCDFIGLTWKTKQI